MFALKKVLFIINSLGQGGAERVVASLANEMCKNNEVTIITIYEDLAYELDPRIHVYVLKQKSGKVGKLLTLFKLKRQLNKLVGHLESKKTFDVMTVHLPFAHLITRNTYFAKRSFFVVHTVYSKEMNLMIAKGLVKYIYLNKHVITVSEGVKNEFDQIFKAKYRTIQVIPNPIDIRLIQKEAEEELDVDFRYILGIGRFEKIKRFDLLIEAFSQSDASAGYKLVLLGDGTEREKLEALCLKLDIKDKVVFPGWQNNPYKWMKNAALLVVTSAFESLGNTLLESLACQRAVVSVDCDYGPREILKAELVPYLVVNQTAKEIAKVMDEALVSYPDELESYVLAYGIDLITQRYLEVG